MTLPADPIPPSRSEARIRLVCAALTGLAASADGHRLVVEGRIEDWSVNMADNCLALLYPEPEEKG